MARLVLLAMQLGGEEVVVAVQHLGRHLVVLETSLQQGGAEAQTRVAAMCASHGVQATQWWPRRMSVRPHRQGMAALHVGSTHSATTGAHDAAWLADKDAPAEPPALQVSAGMR